MDGAWTAWLAGAAMVLQPGALAYIAVGTVLGLLFGVIPGLTAVLCMVLLLPITYGLTPAAGFGLLMGAYVGGITGGLVSAIMLGIPGTPASIVTTLDGHPMSKRGESGRALGLATVASFYGTLASWLALVLLAPVLASFALKIGPFEYAAIILFGFTAITGLSSERFGKSMLMVAIGLTIPAIGLDPLHGVQRMTFGTSALESGFGLVALLSGIYVVSRALEEAETIKQRYIAVPGKLSNVLQQVWKVFLYWKTMIWSAVIGIVIGIMPGVGASVAPFISYDVAKRRSKHPETFGTGEPEGVVASETCNNATIGGALIPGLVLGIPGDVPVIILLSGLMLHGFQPGPLFFTQNESMVYSIYVSFFVATIFMLLFMLFVGIRVFTRTMSIPKVFLIPVIFVAGLLGAYNISYSITDVWISLIAGFGAYFAIKADYPLTPLVVAIILGPMLEYNLRVAMNLSEGSFMPFVTQPISAAFMALTAVTIVLMVRSARRKSKQKAKA